jgi:hypothetical protein
MPLALHRGAPVVCAQCGRTIARRSRQQQYCSDRCRNQNARQRVRIGENLGDQLVAQYPMTQLKHFENGRIVRLISPF